MTIEHLNSIACGLGFFGGFVLRLADDLGPRNAAPSSLTIARRPLYLSANGRTGEPFTGDAV